MNNDQFDKLFNYIEDFRKDVDARFDTQDKHFNDLTSLIDGYASRLDSYA